MKILMKILLPIKTTKTKANKNQSFKFIFLVPSCFLAVQKQSNFRDFWSINQLERKTLQFNKLSLSAKLDNRWLLIVASDIYTSCPAILISKLSTVWQTEVQLEVQGIMPSIESPQI